MEIGQEDNIIPSLPPQAYIEVLLETSQNSRGSVTKSKARAQTEETSESRGEELEQTSKKGRKPNKLIREIEANREKATGNQSILDYLVSPIHGEKNLLEMQENRKYRALPHSSKK